MGLINIYDRISNKSETVKANGKLKDILPEIDFNHSLILKAGDRLSEDYQVTEEDVLYVRKIPGAVSAGVATAIAITAVAVSVVAGGVAVGVSIYANKKSEEAKKQMEKAQKDAQNLAAQTQQLPFIRGAKNKSALGEAVQFVMGSVYNTPYNLSGGFYSIDGGDGKNSYFTSVFSCGYGNQKIKQVFLGNESIVSRESGITGRTAIDSDSIYYSEDSNDCVEVRGPGSNFQDEEWNLKVKSCYSGAELKHDFEKDAEPVIVQAAANAYRIQVCIQFSSLRKYNSEESNWEERTATVRPYWSNDGGATWNEFTFNGSDNNTFTKNKNTNIRYAAEKEFLPSESYGKSISIKVVKETPKEESNTQEDCFLLWYQTFCYDAQKSSSSMLVPCRLVEDELFNKITKIGYKIKATDSTEGILDEFHCLSEAKARTWNGSRWSTEKECTRNPASWLLEVLTSDIHLASKFNDSDIYLPSFGTLYKYCNEEGYYCDGIITAAEKKKDILDKILQLCNSTLIINADGLLEAVTDKRESTPVALLNAENVVSFAFSKSMARKTDGTKITFTNREGWITDTRYSMLDGEAYDYLNDTVDSLAIDYVTDATHAYKVAQRKLRQRQMQNREIKVNVGHEGDYYPLYSTVLLQLPQLLQGLNSSVIRKVNMQGTYITSIEISDLVEFQAGHSYGVIIQATNENGYRLYSIRVTGSGLTRTLECFSPFNIGSNAIIPELGNHVSFGLIDDGGFAQITNVMKIYGIEPNGREGFSLILRDYDTEVYDYSPTGAIPEHKSNLTLPLQRSSGVTVARMLEIQQELRKSIDAIKTSPENIGSPRPVTHLAAVPEESGITVSWSAVSGSGLENAISRYELQISRNSGTTWTALGSCPETSFYYTFVRNTDGYPEAGDLQPWRIRVRAVNVYDKSSEWNTVVLQLSSYGTWIPLAPVFSLKKAGENGIDFQWSAPRTAGDRSLYGTNLYRIKVYYEEALRTSIETGSLSASYNFDRNTDGFPEKPGVTGSLTTLDGFSVTIEVINSSGNSETSRNESVDYSSYLGWKPEQPVIQTRSSGRACTVSPYNPESRYGKIRYRYLVNNPAKDGDTFYMPTPLANYYESVENYRDSTKPDAPFVADSPYTQTMPLQGQDATVFKEYTWLGEADTDYNDGSGRQLKYYETDPSEDYDEVTVRTIEIGEDEAEVNYWYDSANKTHHASFEAAMANPQDTEYRFKVQAFNETADIAPDYNEPVSVTARATGAYDVVNGAITANSLAPDAVTAEKIAAGTVTAEKIFVMALAAISANLGRITDGELVGNQNNYWYLSDEYDQDGRLIHRAGDFRVGGSAGSDYIQCTTQDGTSYNISIHASKFEITAVGTLVHGEFYVCNAGQAVDSNGRPTSYYAKITSGGVEVNGNATVSGQVRITSTNDVSPGSYDTDPLVIGAKTGENIGMDGNEIMARKNGAVSPLYLNSEGGDVIAGAALKQNGSQLLMGATQKNGFYGLSTPANGDADWIRTTSNGVIPYQSGGASAGHCSLGTSSWYFASAYIQNIYGYLNGNISGNAATASKLDGTVARATKAWVTVNLSGLDESKWFPVTFSLGTTGWTEVECFVSLNSGTTPGWSTHAGGFTCHLHLLAMGNGWGITQGQTVVLDRQYSWASVVPAGWTQMTRSSNGVLWLRGGGKYYCWNNKGSGFTVRTSTYTVSSQSVSPTDTYQWSLVPAEMWGTLNGTASKATTADRINSGHASSTYNDGEIWIG